jgi:hypothetical protein
MALFAHLAHGRNEPRRPLTLLVQSSVALNATDALVLVRLRLWVQVGWLGVCPGLFDDFDFRAAAAAFIAAFLAAALAAAAVVAAAVAAIAIAVAAGFVSLSAVADRVSIRPCRQ